ncbi:hypothetical protein L207DRAFT_598037 [Hyaloscypha variabilis F]|uniref:Uncharacterized protein n=1 Tax=Hyaloscypha variabilis (strain UAMH 11265 / GT02V1 / F) TaxID=1149755 RepID=A0A2J6RL77_HYAVF|nr:hypothetical protein L207DRAFT_598037 [Hyaloscypha variabilis F]
MRFILITDPPSNDAVIPISNSYNSCPSDRNGLCSFDNVVSVTMISENLTVHTDLLLCVHTIIRFSTS